MSGASAGVAGVGIRGVSKVFGGGRDAFTALDDVSVDIRRNEFFTLLGPSGCGKTTLLRLVAGFDEPTAGSIHLDGEDIGGLPPFRRPVNTVFQSYALFPHMTVAQNIGFGLRMLGHDRGATEAAVDEMLELVQMQEMKHRRTGQLSGGQQQRVALARALAPRPRLLLLDEPLSALDLKLRKEMQIELKRLQTETGITFVFVTHDQEEALTMSDRVAVMNRGRILQVGTPREIYDQPGHRFVADFIGDINFLRARVSASATGGASLSVEGVGTLECRAADGLVPGDGVTLAVRPERIGLDDPAGAGLPGTVARVVYHGTDTIYHFELPGGQIMRARVQNRATTAAGWGPGDRVAWTVAPESVAIVADGDA